METLEEISLEGNPVMRDTFNCVSKLIVGLKSIKVVNSIKVTDKDRVNAVNRIKREKQLWRNIITQYIKLQSLKNSELNNDSLNPLNINFNENTYRKKKEKKLIAQ